MKKIFTPYFIFLFIILLNFSDPVYCQNSVLVNFGNPVCSTSSAAFFSLIKDPLSNSSNVLSTCDLTLQVPDFYSVFIAYNPKDNNIYVSDVRDGIHSKIWKLDIGLPTGISCPAVIPVLPTYLYNYSNNNFEFDNSGNLWSLSNYDITTGQCNMDKFDVITGNIISTKILQFPAGNFPTAISSGDLTILPNGRLFATLGSFPSRLYEVTNFSSVGGVATANYLQTLPESCYGIAYLNGELELTGADFTSSCYYFDYNISTNTLGPARNFQNGQLPIDNTSITPSIATTKQLVNVVKVNRRTAEVTYEIYVKNYGNVVLNNINVTDDLGAAFGAANVSNVSTSFVPGANAAGLTLNPAYNGTTITNILNTGQNLPNNISTNSNYFFKVQVKCRVSHLSPYITYYNSAIGTGAIGSGASLINVSDSSNNGNASVADPNNNGNAGEIGENIPTPVSFTIAHGCFFSVDASSLNKSTSEINWVAATPMPNAEKFVVEYSIDGDSWVNINEIKIVNPSQENFQFTHQDIPSGNLFYRIKQINYDGSYSYSNVVTLRGQSKDKNYLIFPNPANNYIQINAPFKLTGNTVIELCDANGLKLLTQNMNGSTAEINTADFPAGTYLLKLIHNSVVSTQKIIITH